MIATVLMALSVAAPLVVRDDAKAELDRAQGVWKLTGMESRGEARPMNRAGGVDRYTLVVSGEGYAFMTHGGSVTFNPAAKSLDMKVADGRYKGQAVLGLYDLQGDVLKIAVPTPLNGEDRPKELKSVVGTTYTVYTFARDKAVGKEQAEAKLKEMKAALPAAAAFGPGPGRPPADIATQDLLRQVIEKLDRIEKRLDALEKKGQDKKD